MMHGQKNIKWKY